LEFDDPTEHVPCGELASGWAMLEAFLLPSLVVVVVRRRPSPVRPLQCRNVM
jgi:hypothetical protein